MNVDFVPFIRVVRVLCKQRPEQAAAYFLSYYKRPYLAGELCESVIRRTVLINN